MDTTIDATTITTDNEKRDAHLKSPDFFDAAGFPTITFKSKRAEAVGNGKFKLIGDLTMRGKTKEVVLDVEGPTDPVTAQNSQRVGRHGDHHAQPAGLRRQLEPHDGRRRLRGERRGQGHHRARADQADVVTNAERRTLNAERRNAAMLNVARPKALDRPARPRWPSMTATFRP